ncbi:MAG TPA: hypothetical protein PLZ93_21630 [Nocardioides sp.]|uniref:hypothetical protein n=1 Tax=uncultured Nocardioides sp. TaxID=198441 RepID=UPI00262E1D76|nr:hypothetical protein [uncultured Nocardioides sp.]HRD60367.1 hypothetical protein [Nocardioides sp.]HRI98239.1 hypothetical protein [Nocardioides sp.]HRK48019.1 hypothetical protein [Nocardioides sp.]
MSADDSSHHADECDRHHDLVRDFGGSRPRIVVLCGSTRYFEEFQRQNLRLTLEGAIVLSIGFDDASDDQLRDAGRLPADMEMLQQLHLRKIDLADEVLVLNVDGYLGESTRREIEYARRLGRTITYLVDADAGATPGSTTRQSTQR